MNNEIRIPDIEVIVGAAGDDIACFAFYARDDIHHGYEIVAAVAGASSRPVIRKVLQDALEALNQQDWHSLDELYTGTSAGLEEPPF